MALSAAGAAFTVAGAAAAVGAADTLLAAFLCLVDIQTGKTYDDQYHRDDDDIFHRLTPFSLTFYR